MHNVIFDNNQIISVIHCSGRYQEYTEKYTGKEHKVIIMCAVNMYSMNVNQIKNENENEK